MHNNEANRTVGKVAAVLVAAGGGTRLGGDVPKQYQMLGGRPVLFWSLDSLVNSPLVAQVIVVVAKAHLQWHSIIQETFPKVLVVHGGQNRTQSVQNGLAALANDRPDKVLIHDAARPGLTQGVIAELVAALDDVEAAAPALVMSDSVKRLTDTDRLETIERSDLRRVQTPQAFRYDVIVSALEASKTSEVDELALIERTHAVKLIAGSERLMKVTYAEDMTVATRLLVETSMRIGSGYDVHAFEDGSSVQLCGVSIAHTHQLKGHSDADVAWHALTDAILGALALGDIGDHFPPSDDRWKNASSRIFLEHAVSLASERGLHVSNADMTIICEAPKIGPHREAMRRSTAEVLGVGMDAISVKATTTEKLGFTGRGEGIAAQASVLLAS